jgi:glyoxylase-like metal-dependent hydrolase (beta-lactamase superfamily II)
MFLTITLVYLEVLVFLPGPPQEVAVVMSSPEIRTIVSQPFEENTYLISVAGGREVIVVDPGLEPELILEALRDAGSTAVLLLNTHGHADHIGGNEALKRAFPDAPLLIGAGDAIMLTDANANLSGPFGMPILSPPADRLVKEGDIVEAGGLRFEVYEIPGHSPGHVVFVLRGAPILVFGGDVLFAGSIGRTDFPRGSFDDLSDGIRRKLYTLPDDTLIYPGHGPTTTVGREKGGNPFVRG